MSYNRVILMGNLTRDVELRFSESNTAIGDVGLAVNRKFKGSDQQAREEVTFVDCTAFGRTAEVMAQHLKKGRPVLIEGRLSMDQWQDKQTGQNRTKLKVIVERFQFISDGSGGGKELTTDGCNSRLDGDPVPADDDIPF